MRIAERLFEQGLTPNQLLASMKGVRHPSVLANSIPKSGTNLLVRAFLLVRPYHRPFIRTVNGNNADKLNSPFPQYNSVVPAHLESGLYDLHKEKFSILKKLLIVRDPRDMLVSNLHYLKKDRGHRLNGYFRDLSFKDSVRALIEGVSKEELGLDSASKSVVQMYLDYSDWVSNYECFLVRFEYLVGTAGGGSSDSQYSTLTNLFEFVGIPIDKRCIAYVQQNLFGGKSRTFRKGVIGSWADELDNEDKVYVNNRLAEVLSIYGYSP